MLYFRTHLRQGRSMNTQMTFDIKSLSWNTLLRYQLIEIILLWEGCLTSNHLVDAFGIGRQCAINIIKKYRSQINPDSCYYDQHLKGHRPAKKFVPVVTSSTIDEYMHLLNGRNQKLL